MDGGWWFLGHPMVFVVGLGYVLKCFFFLGMFEV